MGFRLAEVFATSAWQASSLTGIFAHDLRALDTELGLEAATKPPSA
jgi:hypothetical protein